MVFASERIVKEQHEGAEDGEAEAADTDELDGGKLCLKWLGR